MGLAVFFWLFAIIVGALSQFPKFGGNSVPVDKELRLQEVELEMERIAEDMQKKTSELVCQTESSCKKCLSVGYCVWYIAVPGFSKGPNVCLANHEDVPLDYHVLYKVRDPMLCNSGSGEVYGRVTSTTNPPQLPPYLLEFHHDNKSGQGWSHEDLHPWIPANKTVDGVNDIHGGKNSTLNGDGALREDDFSLSWLLSGVSVGLFLGISVTILLYAVTTRFPHLDTLFRSRSNEIPLQDLSFSPTIYDEDQV